MRLYSAFVLLAAALVGLVAVSVPSEAEFPPYRRPEARGQQIPPATVYRLLNVTSGDHLYTIDANEVNALVQNGSHQLEGPVFRLSERAGPNKIPLYRFVWPTGAHFLDTSPVAGVAQGAHQEQLMGYMFDRPRPDLVPLTAWVLPSAGLSFYSTDPRGESAAQGGYVGQGTIGYVRPPQ